MLRYFRWTALPLIAAALAWSPAANAAEVRDRAGMFSPEAVKKADAELNRIERQTGVPIHIETVDAIPGLGSNVTEKAKHDAVNDLALKHARENRGGGLYLLISKRDKVFSRLLVSDHFATAFPEPDRLKVRDALLSSFKSSDMDGGLLAAAAAIDEALPDHKVAEARPQPRRGLVPNAPGRVAVERRPQQEPAQFGIGTLFAIALGILGVLFVIRLLSGAFGGGPAGYPKGMPGGPGMGGPGMGGPGMGGPGYGYGRGGGFFSSMLGGIGGAMAGNWLYDQFSGRHSGGHHTDASGYTPTSGQDDFGSDSPGGDDTWSSGDSGGGGDWGGGDWGGGGGGGDWGGGGDDGGSW